MEIKFPNIDSVLASWNDEINILLKKIQEEGIKEIAKQLENEVKNKLKTGVYIIDDEGKRKKVEGGFSIQIHPNKQSFVINLSPEMTIVEYGDIHNQPQPIIRPLLDQILKKINA